MSIYDDRDIPEESGNSGDKVVVEPGIKTETDLARGNLVFDSYGKVISVGNAVTSVKPGDAVFFDQTTGEDIIIFGKILKILKESEVTLASGKES